MTNRFYNESFSGVIGSTAFPSAIRDQLRQIATGFDDAAEEIDQIAGYINLVRDVVNDFGATGDDLTDNSSAFEAAATWAATNAPCKLNFPAGVYRYSTSVNWAITGLTLNFDNVEFVCTSTVSGHTGLLIHAFVGGGAADDPIIQQVNLQGSLIVTCNAQCAYGVRAYGLARLKWNGSVRVRGGNTSTGRAFSIEACSLCDFGQLLCSRDIDNPVDGWTFPYYGIYLDTGTRNGVGLGSSTNNTFRQIDMAGVSVGVTGVAADQNVFLSGAAESCLSRGVNWGAGSRLNTMIGFAMEGNATNDVSDAGVSNSFWNCYSLSTGGMILQGKLHQVVGGLYETIDIQSGTKHARVRDLVVNYIGSGGFTDAGTSTRWSGLYDQQAADFIRPLRARTEITVSGNPFTWTNDTGDWVEIIIQTGTISGIVRTRPDDSSWAAPINVPQTQPLGPGESIAITYSVSPALSYLPMNGMEA